ncbi:MAG: hypothetical protein ACOYON_14075 [Fimbriimonas sp.]
MALVRLVQDWQFENLDTVRIPHAWGTERPITDEGPAIYRTQIQLGQGNPHLLFRGVSYEARVSINDELVAVHRGIWDAFTVPLAAYTNQLVEVAVQVTKNGGPTFPVRDVASGFLPYVFHTFGGIHGEVELHDGPPTLEFPATPSRVKLEGRKVFVDGEPLYMRGLLHWGWYPELRHTNPSRETIRTEVRAAQALGFNLVKFCLWVPPHAYLEVLEEEGMFGWLELPLWAPSANPDAQKTLAHELEQIVRQYRHHSTLLLWTVGCELSHSTPVELRQQLTQMVQNLTGCPLVKDNSGGAEMYGGDLREFGTFEDFHPYGEATFYPLVLDTLQPGPRTTRPIFLGECNDFDVARNFERLKEERPYWASADPDLNDIGVRWQYDLPGILAKPIRHHEPAFFESSRKLALFVRKTNTEAIRARQDFGGYVLTGWRDTPISTAGFFDDWHEARFTPEELAPWNGPDCLFIIPHRSPPWVNGGNRPGWLDPFCVHPGPNLWRIGLHSEQGTHATLTWQIVAEDGSIVSNGESQPTQVESLSSQEVGQICWAPEAPGEFSLRVQFGAARNEWPITVVPSLEPLDGTPIGPLHPWDGTKWTGSGPLVGIDAPANQGVALRFQITDGTIPMPFWREAAHKFSRESGRLGLDDAWHRWLSISPDCALDPDWLDAHFNGWQPLITRVDTRTDLEHPILVKAGPTIVTTIRPFGGLGMQPRFSRNPSGQAALRGLLAMALG